MSAWFTRNGDMVRWLVLRWLISGLLSRHKLPKSSPVVNLLANQANSFLLTINADASGERSVIVSCTTCKKNGHTSDKCWRVLPLLGGWEDLQDWNTENAYPIELDVCHHRHLWPLLKDVYTWHGWRDTIRDEVDCVSPIKKKRKSTEIIFLCVPFFAICSRLI